MRRSTVFFDWGGTLAHTGELGTPAHAWAGVLEDFGEVRTEEQIRLALATATRTVGHLIYSYVRRTAQFWELFDGRVVDALQVGSRREEIVRTIQRIFEDESRVQLYPDARPTLVALRNQGYRTGIISNHHDALLREIRRHELAPLLDSVTFSQEAGAEKPDPRVFVLALQRAGCVPADAVHVGDSLEADVVGARDAGIAPVWLNRSRLEASPDCPTVQGLEELLPLLGRAR